jgi:hypothetical protein
LLEEAVGIQIRERQVDFAKRLSVYDGGSVDDAPQLARITI